MRIRYVVPLLAVAVLLALLLRGDDAGRSPRAVPDGAEEAVEGARWWITFLGPGDRPLVGVPVTVFPEEQVVRTDASGTAALPGPEGATFLAVGDPFTVGGRVLDDPRTVVRLPGLLPLAVEFREVDTGRAWTPGSVRLVTRYGELPLDHGRIDVSPLSADRWHTVDVAFDASPGRTTLDGLRLGLSPYISVDATRVRATVALWPELELTVRVVDLDERPVAGATVKAAYLDERYDEWVHEVHVAAAPADREGRTRVRGVPRIVGLPLTVVVEAGGLSGFEETRITPGETRMQVVASSDDEWSPPTSNTTIGIGGGGARLPTLEGEVFRRDGRPGAGAYVSIKSPGTDLPLRQRADAGGRFRMGVPPGRHTVWLTGPGLVPTPVVAEVAREGTTHVTLREAEGWTLRVRTVDAEGRPLPYRPLAVEHTASGASYALLEGGTQVVPLLTGADGTLALPNLGNETVRVSVRVRGRVLAQATVPCPGSRDAAVELRLK